MRPKKGKKKLKYRKPYIPLNKEQIERFKKINAWRYKFLTYYMDTGCLDTMRHIRVIDVALDDINKEDR